MHSKLQPNSLPNRFDCWTFNFWIFRAAEMPQLSTFLMPRASPHWDKKNQPIINTLINAPFTRLNKWQFGLKCIFKLMKTRCGEMRKIKSLTFCDPSPSQKREINLPFPLIPLIHGHFICIKMYVENTPSLWPQNYKATYYYSNSLMMIPLKEKISTSFILQIEQVISRETF